MIIHALISYGIFISNVFLTKSQVIKTKNGELQGRTSTSYDGKNFIAFEGIPYAKPPTGQLRFKEPIPAEPWTGTLKANKFYKCVHLLPILMTSVFGQEDCLYLNVYVPGDEVIPGGKKDVVVHIHGGAFMLGSPEMMAKPGYIMSQDVVYVSMNYRLGIFGFLSTEDASAPGNNGLKDQTLALKWIQENIADFGGNPASVTLTGISAGSASVYYHYLSPRSKGLFHRGYAMSGTPLNPWALTERPREKALKLGAIFNCTAESSEVMLQCLRKIPALDLGNAIKQFVVFMDVFPVTPFGPVVEIDSETAFMTTHPYALLAEGKIENDVPLIMSNVAEEGIYPVGAFVTFQKLKDVDEKWDELAPYLLDFQDTVPADRHAEVARKIRSHYLKDEKISRDNLSKLIKLFSDRLFFLGSQMTLHLHQGAAKAPLYYLSSSYVPTQMGLFPSVRGAGHISDCKLIFQLIIHPSVLSDGDRGMMELLTSMLSSFAKDGTPSIPNIKWSAYQALDGYKYLNVNSSRDYGVQNFVELASVEFWDSLGIEENNFIKKD